MSRIGKQPVTIPAKVDIRIDGATVTVKGPLGELQRTFKGVTLEKGDGAVTVKPSDQQRTTRALWGLARALLQNMVSGVSTGFVKALEIQGVGYRAEIKGTELSMSVGFSHPIKFELPKGVKGEVEKNTLIRLSSADKELLGQTAATIRGFKPPEPYKGKGVRYVGEHVRRKAGKAAK